jgi:hypothetical protein
MSKLTAGPGTTSAPAFAEDWFTADEFEPGMDLPTPDCGGISGAFSLIFIVFSYLLL